MVPAFEPTRPPAAFCGPVQEVLLQATPSPSVMFTAACDPVIVAGTVGSDPGQSVPADQATGGNARERQPLICPLAVTLLIRPAFCPASAPMNWLSLLGNSHRR